LEVTYVSCCCSSVTMAINPLWNYFITCFYDRGNYSVGSIPRTQMEMILHIYPHTHAHTLTCSHPHTYAHTLTHMLTPSHHHTLIPSQHALTHYTLTHMLTPSYTCSHLHILTHMLTPSRTCSHPHSYCKHEKGCAAMGMGWRGGSTSRSTVGCSQWPERAVWKPQLHIINAMPCHVPTS